MPPLPPMRRAHVVVAEAERQTRRAISEALARDGHQVIEARTGLELLEELSAPLQARGRLRPPDVVVTSAHLPGVGGIEVIARMRRRGWHGPAVVLGSESEGQVRARLVPWTVVIPRPVDPSLLRRVVRRLVQRAQEARAAP